MEPARELGKVLLILGIVIAAVGAFSAGGSEAAVPAGKIAGRYFVSRTKYEFLFSDCDVHCVERGVDAYFLDYWGDPAVRKRGAAFPGGA